MIISTQHNRFYRAVLKEFRDQLVSLRKDDKEAQKITADDVKLMLAYKNPNYPKDEIGMPLSTTKITPKQLNDHLEFIFREGAQRGFRFRNIDEEWERLKKIARQNGY